MYRVVRNLEFLINAGSYVFQGFGEGGIRTLDTVY